LKVIHIEWEGPFVLEQLSSLKNEEIDYGVYQIYGSHPVYGSDVLLYIGKADGQTFGVRIKQEYRWEYNEDTKNIKIYVGRLAGSTTPDDDEWSEQIDLCERLLIYAHGPAYNSRGLNTIPDQRLMNTHVLNWGCYRNLLPEVSGARWTSKYDTMRVYEVYGKHGK